MVVNYLKSMIRNEVSAMSFRFLVGVVLVSVIVFSLFQLGAALQVVLSPLENGLVLESVVFSFVAIACSILFYFLFNTTIKRSPVDVLSVPPALSAGLQVLAVNFAQGFILGFVSRRRSQTPVIPINLAYSIFGECRFNNSSRRYSDEHSGKAKKITKNDQNQY